jgi:hypothetical protein
MRYILLVGLLFLSACGSTPNRCNQKYADTIHPHYAVANTIRMAA